MFREVRRPEARIEKVTEKKDEAWRSIKPSSEFNMTKKEIEDFWLNEFMKASEEA